MSRKLFVNLRVRDLPATQAFFGKLGFTFNPAFTNELAACMILSEEAYVMLLTPGHFDGFAKKPVADSTETTAGIYALAVESRDEVDALWKTAIDAGATKAADAIDHGFMYVQSFYDLDGYHWELFWMDPAAIPA